MNGGPGTDPFGSEEPRHNGRSARGLASDAEHSLLGIVHIAEANDRPLDAVAIYGTLSGLTRTLEHLPEVLTRLRAMVLTQHDAGALSIRAGRYAGDPDAAAAQLTSSVDDVLGSFGALRDAMMRAQASVSDARFDDVPADDDESDAP